MDSGIPSFSYRENANNTHHNNATVSRDDFNNTDYIFDSDDIPNSNDIGSENLLDKDFPNLPSTSGRSHLNVNNIIEGSRLRNNEKKKPAVIKKLNLERWRNNPLKFQSQKGGKKSEKKIPLSGWNLERISEKYINSEEFELEYNKVIERMDKLFDDHIEADIAEFSKEEKTPWGSPIKVGTSKQTFSYC